MQWLIIIIIIKIQSNNDFLHRRNSELTERLQTLKCMASMHIISFLVSGFQNVWLLTTETLNTAVFQAL